MHKEYDFCTLCPRRCNAKRNEQNAGFCGQKNKIVIGRADLHFWEEPCISGKNGSGTVFFSGCPLKCVYCQNYALARGRVGHTVTNDELCNIYIELQKKGAHNINLVTAEHFAPDIVESVRKARGKGLNIPIVLNSSGYISVETLKMLENTVDIYLVDFKYMDSILSKEYSNAEDYAVVAKEALREMVRQKAKPVYEGELLKSGVIVRHLCLPSHTRDSENVLEYVYNTYKENVILSIMSQYTPMKQCENIENLSRKLTKKEYDRVVDFCIDMGVENAFIQGEEAASKSFIPEFM